MTRHFQTPAAQPVGAVQPGVVAQTGDGAAMSANALWRLDRFTKLFTTTCGGRSSEDLQDYLDNCHEVLWNMGIVETNGADFAAFCLLGSSKTRWRDYCLSRPTGLPALTLDQFSQLFLEKFLPITQREDYRRQDSFGRVHPPRSFHSALQTSHGASGGRGSHMQYSDQQSYRAPSAPIRAPPIHSYSYGQPACQGQFLFPQAHHSSGCFECRCTYSYVSSYFAPYLVVPRDSLSAPVYVSTPVGNSIIVDRVYHLCVVTIGGLETRVDLLLLDIVDFDVILEMDWLSLYHAVLDYYTKIVTLALPGIPRLEWRGTSGCFAYRVISYMKARRMVEKGCLAYLAYVRDFSAEVTSMDSVPVVTKFAEANVVADGLSRKLANMGSLAYIPVGERPLALDVQALANQFVRLDVSKPSCVFASTVTCSSLFERIKDRQYDNPHLLVLRDMVRHGGAKQVTIGDGGVLRMHGRICVPNKIEIPEWKWERITMDFVVGLPQTQMKFDTVWVIVDRLTKSANFIPVAYSYSSERLAEIYIQEIVRLHGVPVSIISDKYHDDPSHLLDFSTVQLDNDLTYEEESVAILDKQVRQLRSKSYPSVHVQWKDQPAEAAT
ncbi:uncharacterized protein [Nicotiana sylvestris]|uniref:uncharacterized protein n=1 Tax=Nicotiana sylvestris TaxID=4096 RepID=UPI00388CD062